MRKSIPPPGLSVAYVVRPNPMNQFTKRCFRCRAIRLADRMALALAAAGNNTICFVAGAVVGSVCMYIALLGWSLFSH